MNRRVLVVSDKQKNYADMKSALEQLNVEVLCVSSVAAALDEFIEHSYCLVFIDMHLPWSDRTEMIRVMRSVKIVPIIVLTGPLKKDYQKELYQAGVSVIVKEPVDYRICAMQVNNFIEMYSGIEDSLKKSYPIFFGTEFVIDPQSRQVTVKGTDLTLTRLEFDLLFCLASYPGQTLSSEQLYTKVWKVKHNQGANDTVKVHVGKLRKKLSAISDHTYIENKWGVGYKFISPICK